MGGRDESANAETTPNTGTDGETSVPAEITRLDAGEVLCDRHRKECFVVQSIEEHGTRLRQDERDFFVPHSLLAPWVDSRLYSVDESESADLPAWLSAE